MTRAIISVVLGIAGTFIVLSHASAATIIGSKHDLSNAGQKEVCIFCHTPHNANPSLPGLWNRDVSADALDFKFYSSATLTGRPSGNKPGTYSLLCLGCHDSVRFTAANGDPHNMLNGLQSDGWDDCIKCHPNGFDPPRPGFLIGPDLSNDHPISFTYPINGNSKLKKPTDGSKGWVSEKVRLFNGQMECSSCHNPHDPTFTAFLVKDKSSSQLCLTCHIK